jgi:outer membrane lipopolysaccharide assembly protein LptE/RlpB
MHHWLILAAVLPLTACAVPLREETTLPVVARLPEVYSRSETDAINAQAECKRLARNLVQIARCDVRR